jgi:hypothetical protein
MSTILTRDEWQKSWADMWGRAVDEAYADSLRKALKVSFRAALDEVISRTDPATLPVVGRIIDEIAPDIEDRVARLFEIEFAERDKTA